MLTLRVLVGQCVPGCGQRGAAGGAPGDAAPAGQQQSGHLGVKDEHVQRVGAVGAGNARADELRDEGLYAGPCRA
ncbi:hypothetical protein [Myxococcus xanthus]|uniref:Uncharacterized protein n=1 Tax=Myxococcus xanthus TaxID=34 RepID=A0A7Y4IIB9_MYXXA|nr:hypothetical protein [Myxococcus xanthus]NOJ79823.1 hypothetical protein [Myxococcus xanthus]NOJ86828.1 hypothetical protein [Myxococcus xanthus]